MPRVPRYDESQVDLRPLPTVRQDARVTSGLRQAAEFTDALGQAGETLQRAATVAQERTDADLLFRSEAGIDEASRAFETEALLTQGANAWGVHDKGKQFWDDSGRKFGEEFTTPRQQRLWAQSLARMRSTSLDRLASHEARQRRVSLEQSTNASIVGLTNAAAVDPTPENIAAQRTEILKRRQVLADLNGEDIEVRKVKDFETVSNLHAQVLDGMIERNPAEAGRYLKANKGEIDPRKLPDIERTVRQGTLKAIAQEMADTLELAGVGESDGLAEIRKKYEGDEESAAVAEWKARKAEVRAAVETDQKAAADEAYGIVNQTKRLSAVPASVRARMDQKVLRALEQDLANDRGTGDKVKTDWNRYADLRQMAVDDSAGFRALDLRAEFGRLAPAEREKLLDLQTKTDSSDKIAEVRSVDSQIGATIRPLGLKAADAAVAEDAIRAEIDVEQRRKGGKLGQDERQKIIDRMLVNGEVIAGRGFFSIFQNDPNRRYFQLRPEERERFEVEVPDEDRDTIVRWFKENKGRVPTDYEVEQKYRQALGIR